MITDTHCATPLAWPVGKRRTLASSRRSDGLTGDQDRSIAYAVRRIRSGLDRLGASEAVVWSNLELRAEGASDAKGPEPEDPGVCVQFHAAREGYAVACDQFETVFGNMMAIARHIEGAIGLERHGVGSGIEAMRSFLRTTAPEASAGWRAILGDLSTVEQVKVAYRRLSAEHHPDKATGSHDAMAELSRARDEALKDLQNRGAGPGSGASTETEVTVFDSTRAFAAMRSAERFLEERGFSFGRNERAAPRGILLGAYDIAVWRELSPEERAALDGTMTGDMRRGPVRVTISRAAMARSTWRVSEDAALRQRHKPPASGVKKTRR